MSSAHLTILRGPPGSGKTTEARRMVDAGEADMYVEADDYFTSVGGRYTFRASELADAHAWCRERARVGLESGWHVVVSNTALRVWEFKPYLDMAERLGVPVTVRVMEGRYPNVHGVPDAKVEKMRRDLEPWPLPKAPWLEGD